MTRRLDGSDKGVLITKEAARRIQRVVQRIEGGSRDVPPLPLRTAYDDGDVPVRLCKTTAAWQKNSTATLEVWEAYNTVTTPEESDPAETVENVVNIHYDVPAGVFVIVAKAQNDRWYLVDAGIPDEASGCQAPAIAGQDITTLEGYDGTKTQVLGHESGCLKWFDTTECDLGSGS